ncbi:MAG TPA: glycosyl hydrolase 108 family protein [Gemmatimonadales bacterium]|nr:glycosyl hydrolase 108 family protein [Gemmatimonadales bacterium]
MSDFPKALPVILEEEGGWYDGSQPWDPNPTMHGITQARYDSYRGALGGPRQSVQLISDQEVQDIYLEDYWIPCHADALPWPASLLHFDFAVNAGPEEAITVLQRALHVDDDGIWGPETAAAAPRAGLVPDAMLLERLFAYELIVKKNPVKATPLWQEWIPRVNDLYRRFT